MQLDPIGLVTDVNRAREGAKVLLAGPSSVSPSASGLFPGTSARPAWVNARRSLSCVCLHSTQTAQAPPLQAILPTIFQGALGMSGHETT